MQAQPVQGDLHDGGSMSHAGKPVFFKAYVLF